MQSTTTRCCCRISQQQLLHRPTLPHHKATTLHTNISTHTQHHRTFAAIRAGASSTDRAAAHRKQRGGDEADGALKHEFKSMVHKMLTPQPYVETRTSDQLISDKLFSHAYARYTMQQHRVQQMAERRKLIRRWEALNALPEELKAECMKVDTSQWPLWMTQPTEQPGRSVHEGYEAQMADHQAKQEQNQKSKSNDGANKR